MDTTLWSDNVRSRRRRRRKVDYVPKGAFSITDGDDCIILGHTLNHWDLAGCTTCIACGNVFTAPHVFQPIPRIERRSPYCASFTKNAKGRYTMQYNPYGEEYEEQIAFQYNQQQPRPHRDVQRLPNTTNAPLPNRKPRAAAQRQAETEARQRNLRGNSTRPPDALPRWRGRNHHDDDATAQPPRSALRFRPTDGAGASTIPGVPVVQHTHNEPFIARSSPLRGLPQGTRHQQPVYTDEIEEGEQETERLRRQPPKRGRTRIRLNPLV